MALFRITTDHGTLPIFEREQDMAENGTPAIGFVLGDHAGIGPEVVAKILAGEHGECIPVLIGNEPIFRQCCHDLHLDLTIAESKPFDDPSKVYFIDVPAGSDIRAGKPSCDSGKLILDSLVTAIENSKAGNLDALVLAPLTNHSLHLSGGRFDSEFQILAHEFALESVKSVVKSEDWYRSNVIGHCPFREILDRLTTYGIVQTGRELLEVMEIWGAKYKKIAVAALNPHAGENGLFGDEEERIIQPAIDILLHDGVETIGPVSADTMMLKARSGQIGGLVYLYHDQGNIAMKSSFFDDSMLIYTNVPLPIVSVGHGSALDIAGQGRADPRNMALCLHTLLDMLRNKTSTQSML